jgi:capsular exopolysaccharide synthesis family protein
MQPKKTQTPTDAVPGQAQGSGYGYGTGYGYGYSSQGSADFARTWHLLLEKGWIIVVALLICLGLGFAYLKTAPTLYSATTTIQAEQDQPNILKMQMVQLKDLQAVDYLQTVAQSLTNRPLFERVAEANHLWTDPKFLIETNKPVSHNQVMVMLGKMVKVKLRRSTRLIDITVTHRDAELASKIANSIVSEYISTGAEREDSAIGLASKSLAAQAERLKKKLEESENALQAYKEQHQAASFDDKENTVVTKLKELSSRVTEAKSARIKIETDYEQALKLGKNVDALLNVPTVSKDATVLQLELNLTKAEDDFAALSKRYKEKHPKYIQAMTQISELKGDITNAVLSAVQTLKSGLDAARTSENALTEAMKKQEAAALELSKLSVQYTVLQRDVESDRALYDAVLNGMKEAVVTKDTQQTGIVRVVEPAYPPELPSSPKKAAIMAMSGIGGIFMGVFIVLGLKLSDTSIKTVDDAEMMLGLSVFSAVPRMNGIRNGHVPLLVLEKAQSDGAEAFRTLRASLLTLNKMDDKRVFLFTSAMPSEGKTFCSMNFAASLAQIGHKTLLIDADMRRPCVETDLLGAKTDNPGVTDYLLGTKKLKEVVRETKMENLFLLSGGSIAVNPAELLAKDGLGGLIEDALQHYDRVVLDSAPINAVSDTLLMLKNVETLCLVVRAASTSSRYVMRCVQLLQGVEAPLSGIILNQMPRRRGPGYGAYYDYQYHGKYGKEGVYGAK